MSTSSDDILVMIYYTARSPLTYLSNKQRILSYSKFEVWKPPQFFLICSVTDFNLSLIAIRSQTDRNI